MNRFQTLFFTFIAVSFFAGCGSGEPTVVMPTETYEPTETEQANAELEATEREQENNR